MQNEEHRRRIDVLAIGLFGLAVGALTLGVAQVGAISESNKVGTLVIALMFGGIVQILAGITDIRYHEQLGGTALTMYGFFWTTVCIAKLVSESTSFHLDMVLYAPIKFCVRGLLRRHGLSHGVPECDAVHTPRRDYGDILLHGPRSTRPDHRDVSWSFSYGRWLSGVLSCRGQPDPGLHRTPARTAWSALAGTGVIALMEWRG